MRNIRFICMIFVVLLVCSACLPFIGSKPKGIKIHWENIEITSHSQEVNTQGISMYPSIILMSQEGELVLNESKGYETSVAYSPLGGSESHVTANLVGGGNSSGFKFNVESSPELEWEKISVNKIRLSNEKGSKGTVVVTNGDLTSEVPFVIHKSGGVSSSTCWTRDNTCGTILFNDQEMKQGFRFEDGAVVDFDDGDIRMNLGEEVILTPYGHVKYPIQGDHYMNIFNRIADVTNMTFDDQEISRFDRSRHIYLIRTADGGYVKAFFNMALKDHVGVSYAFFYDYSPDGVFETY